MKQQRNSPCACGSGAKYKNCCQIAERDAVQQAVSQRNQKMRARIDYARQRYEEAQALLLSGIGPAMFTPAQDKSESPSPPADSSSPA